MHGNMNIKNLPNIQARATILPFEENYVGTFVSAGIIIYYNRILTRDFN